MQTQRPLRARAPRGFTLLELLITLVIMSILMVGVAGVVISQSRIYELSARTRGAVAASRASSTYLDQRLRMAAWGVNPVNAFDFSVTRDSITGPDELVFFSRDPAFYRVTTGYTGSGTTLNLASALTGSIYPGQVLLVVCPNGLNSGYVTVSTLAEKDDTQLTLYAAASPAVFPRQALPSCGSEQPFVMKVDRYRFFVGLVADGGATPRPYLMLDRGLNVSNTRAWSGTTHRYTEVPAGAQLSNDNLLDASPIAANIEDFQVAYLMNRPDASWGITVATTPGTNWVFGDGTTVAQPDILAAAPLYEDEYRAARRFSAHPANIRGVRVTLVARSDKDFGLRNVRPAAENRPAGTVVDGFYRNVLTTQVSVRNMLSRAEFAPVRVVSSGGI